MPSVAFFYGTPVPVASLPWVTTPDGRARSGITLRTYKGCYRMIFLVGRYADIHTWCRYHGWCLETSGRRSRFEHPGPPAMAFLGPFRLQAAVGKASKT